MQYCVFAVVRSSAIWIIIPHVSSTQKPIYMATCWNCLLHLLNLGKASSLLFAIFWQFFDLGQTQLCSLANMNSQTLVPVTPSGSSCCARQPIALEPQGNCNQCWCPLMIGFMLARKNCISTTECAHMALSTWTVASGAICH